MCSLAMFHSYNIHKGMLHYIIYIWWYKPFRLYTLFYWSNIYEGLYVEQSLKIIILSTWTVEIAGVPFFSGSVFINKIFAIFWKSMTNIKRFSNLNKKNDGKLWAAKNIIPGEYTNVILDSRLTECSTFIKDLWNGSVYYSEYNELYSIKTPGLFSFSPLFALTMHIFRHLYRNI